MPATPAYTASRRLQTCPAALQQSIIRCLCAIKAVSYTHLDVYKRQGQVQPLKFFCPAEPQAQRQGIQKSKIAEKTGCNLNLNSLTSNYSRFCFGGCLLYTSGRNSKNRLPAQSVKAHAPPACQRFAQSYFAPSRRIFSQRNRLLTAPYSREF